MIGTEPPWLRKLRQECAAHGQRVVAQRLRVSQSTLNQVLKGSYKASTKHIEQRVRGEFLLETVNCPVFDEISLRLCQQYQTRMYPSDHPLVQLTMKTCPTCVNATVNRKAPAEVAP